MKKMFTVFKTPNQYYLFDGNISKLVCVSESMFFSLQRILDDKAEEGDFLYLKKLQENGICLDSALKEIEHPETPLIESYFDNMLGGICLQITQNCNLRCSYCPYSENSDYVNRHHNKGTMPLSTALSAIDYYFEHSKNSKRHHVSFYGGEPLLEIKLIQQIVRYIQKNYPHIDVAYPITTNATLLTNEVIDFLVENHFSITISLDGPQEYHDQHRLFSNGRGSFETVVEKLTNFKNRYPKEYEGVAFNSVMVPENDYSKYTDFFCDSPITKDNIFSLVRLSPNYTDVAAQYPDEYFISAAYNRLGGMLWSIGSIQLNDLDPFTVKWVGSVTEKFREIQNMGAISPKTHPGGPCIPGKDKLFVNIFGEFFPCERVSETSELMKIGDIFKGIDIEKIKNIINVARCTQEQCASCWCFSHCTQCAAYADDLGKKWSSTRRLSHCKEVRLAMLDQLRDICFLSENGYNFQKRILGEE